MTLRDILERYADDLPDIVRQIEQGQLDAETEDQLRERIAQTPSAEKQVLVDEYPDLASIEQALGLDPTFPDPFATPEVDGPDDIDVDVQVLSAEQQDAVEYVEGLLERAPDRGIEWFQDLEEALRTGIAEPAQALTQDRLDLIPDSDRERLRDLAEQQFERLRQADLDLDDFDGIKQALEAGGGRGIPYFRNVIAELRGEQDPQRIPGDELDLAPDHVIEEAIEVGEAQIERLQTDDRPDPAPDRRPGDQTDAERMTPDIGRAESRGDRFEITEDYISGERVTRDLDFEERFAVIARRLGRAGKFDITDPRSKTDRRSYFQLTPENQRTYYDVVPKEWFARVIRRGEMTYQELLNEGIPEDRLPDPDDL